MAKTGVVVAAAVAASQRPVVAKAAHRLANLVGSRRVNDAVASPAGVQAESLVAAADPVAIVAVVVAVRPKNKRFQISRPIHPSW